MGKKKGGKKPVDDDLDWDALDDFAPPEPPLAADDGLGDQPAGAETGASAPTPPSSDADTTAPKVDAAAAFLASQGLGPNSAPKDDKKKKKKKKPADKKKKGDNEDESKPKSAAGRLAAERLRLQQEADAAHAAAVKAEEERVAELNRLDEEREAAEKAEAEKKRKAKQEKKDRQKAAGKWIFGGGRRGGGGVHFPRRQVCDLLASLITHLNLCP